MINTGRCQGVFRLNKIEKYTFIDLIENVFFFPGEITLQYSENKKLTYESEVLLNELLIRAKILPNESCDESADFIVYNTQTVSLIKPTTLSK